MLARLRACVDVRLRLEAFVLLHKEQLQQQRQRPYPAHASHAVAAPATPSAPQRQGPQHDAHLTAFIKGVARAVARFDLAMQQLELRVCEGGCGGCAHADGEEPPPPRSRQAKRCRITALRRLCLWHSVPSIPSCLAMRPQPALSPRLGARQIAAAAAKGRAPRRVRLRCVHMCRAGGAGVGGCVASLLQLVLAVEPCAAQLQLLAGVCMCTPAALRLAPAHAHATLSLGARAAQHATAAAAAGAARMQRPQGVAGQQQQQQGRPGAAAAEEGPQHLDVEALARRGWRLGGDGREPTDGGDGDARRGWRQRSLAHEALAGLHGCASDGGLGASLSLWNVRAFPAEQQLLDALYAGGRAALCRAVVAGGQRPVRAAAGREAPSRGWSCGGRWVYLWAQVCCRRACRGRPCCGSCSRWPWSPSCSSSSSGCTPRPWLQVRCGAHAQCVCMRRVAGQRSTPHLRRDLTWRAVMCADVQAPPLDGAAAPAARVAAAALAPPPLPAFLSHVRREVEQAGLQQALLWHLQPRVGEGRRTARHAPSAARARGEHESRSNAGLILLVVGRGARAHAGNLAARLVHIWEREFSALASPAAGPAQPSAATPLHDGSAAPLPAQLPPAPELAWTSPGWPAGDTQLGTTVMGDDPSGCPWPLVFGAAALQQVRFVPWREAGAHLDGNSRFPSELSQFCGCGRLLARRRCRCARGAPRRPAGSRWTVRWRCWRA